MGSDEADEETVGAVVRRMDRGVWTAGELWGPDGSTVDAVTPEALVLQAGRAGYGTPSLRVQV
jgi:hypothetical protein